jgi:hypothetical protein
MSKKASEHVIRLETATKPELDEADAALANAPLFAVADDADVSHIMVTRTDPYEGTLGRMPPTTTELEIKRKWGGGTFQLQARNERNRMIKGGFKTLEISGDPIFESLAAQKKWERRNGLEEDAPAPPSDAIGIKEIFALLNSTESKQKAEADRRSAEQEAAHKRELERLRVEGEIRTRDRAEEDARRERMAQEREERRRKEDEERDERRRREQEDRDERRRKDEEAARLRDREFQVSIAQISKKGNADGSEMLLKGIQLAKDLGTGDGPTADPFSAIAAALLPGVADKLGLVGGGKSAPVPAGGGPPAGAASADAVTFDGALGKKTREVIAHLEAEGYDPESAIATVLDQLKRVKRKTAPAAPAVAAATSPAGALPAAPAPKATPAPNRRTTKK